jgi:hypothetical protein
MMRIAKTTALLGICLIVGSSLCKARTANERRLIELLREQGFTGALEGDIHFKALGHLACDQTTYRVLYFEWVQTGGARHMQQRLLFLENRTRYIGSYVVNDPPAKVTSDSIVFGYTKDSGNTITCNEIGTDKQELLNGELSPFFK